jgi:hypothetical protein
VPLPRNFDQRENKFTVDESLFAIPKDYVKYNNLVEVASEGKLGSRLEKKPAGKRKLFK